MAEFLIELLNYFMLQFPSNTECEIYEHLLGIYCEVCNVLWV